MFLHFPSILPSNLVYIIIESLRKCVRVTHLITGGPGGALKGVNEVKFQNATLPSDTKLKENQSDILHPHNMLYQKCVRFEDQTIFGLCVLGQSSVYNVEY